MSQSVVDITGPAAETQHNTQGEVLSASRDSQMRPSVRFQVRVKLLPGESLSQARNKPGGKRPLERTWGWW